MRSACLRERLRSKEVWVEGADRYRNPDQDLPGDFERERPAYYAALKLPSSADSFLAGVQREMHEALAAFHDGLATNESVCASLIRREAGSHCRPCRCSMNRQIWPPSKPECLNAGR